MTKTSWSRRRTGKTGAFAADAAIPLFAGDAASLAFGAAMAVLVFACLASATTALASWTIVGTTTRSDGVTGVEKAKITRFPDSLTVLSDGAGDFFIPWDGSRGWLKVQLPDGTPKGSSWCKRVALFPRQATRADSSFDVGVIEVGTNILVTSPASPTLPPGMTPPQKLRLSGPGPGELEQYWFVIRLTTDIWGQSHEAKKIAGDPTPPRLVDAVMDWIKQTRWSVQTETPCPLDPPFVAIEHFSYTWSDSVWVFAGSRRPDSSPEGRSPKTLAKP